MFGIFRLNVFRLSVIRCSVIRCTVIRCSVIRRWVFRHSVIRCTVIRRSVGESRHRASKFTPQPILNFNKYFHVVHHAPLFPGAERNSYGTKQSLGEEYEACLVSEIEHNPSLGEANRNSWQLSEQKQLAAVRTETAGSCPNRNSLSHAVQ